MDRYLICWETFPEHRIGQLSNWLCFHSYFVGLSRKGSPLRCEWYKLSGKFLSKICSFALVSSGGGVLSRNWKVKKVKFKNCNPTSDWGGVTAVRCWFLTEVSPPGPRKVRLLAKRPAFSSFNFEFRSNYFTITQYMSLGRRKCNFPLCSCWIDLN